MITYYKIDFFFYLKFIPNAAIFNFSDNATMTCPVDQEVFTKGDMRKDKGCSKEINSLKVDCPSTNPCEWQGLLSEMQVTIIHACSYMGYIIKILHICSFD